MAEQTRVSLSKVLSFLGSNKLLSQEFILRRFFFQGCAWGKSIRLPFQISDNIHTSTFNLVRSNVWQSPVVFLSAYKYFVLFTNDYTQFTGLFMQRKSEVINHFENFLVYINGLAECKNLHIPDVACTLLITSHVPLSHWVDALINTQLRPNTQMASLKNCFCHKS